MSPCIGRSLLLRLILIFGVTLSLLSTRSLHLVDPVHAQDSDQSGAFDGGAIEVSTGLDIDDSFDLDAYSEAYTYDCGDPYIDDLTVELDLDQDGYEISSASDTDPTDAYTEIDGRADGDSLYGSGKRIRLRLRQQRR